RREDRRALPARGGTTRARGPRVAPHDREAPAAAALDLDGGDAAVLDRRPDDRLDRLARAVPASGRAGPPHVRLKRPVDRSLFTNPTWAVGVASRPWLGATSTRRASASARGG